MDGGDDVRNLGAGDSYLKLNLLPPELAEEAYERLSREVSWNKMKHRGGDVPRLVAVEGLVDEDGSYPIYRHPADESPSLRPFTRTVSLIRAHVERALGGQPVNHVLIQRYRSGADYISEHSDKTVDVVRGSNIVNVSLGAQRVMTLRLKKKRDEAVGGGDDDDDGDDDDGGGGGEGTTVTSTATMIGKPRLAQRIPLPHNSMFVMGPETNRRWLHGIKHDNRPMHVKSAAERENDGARISLTFRHIGTFLNAEGTKIYGQGARGKTKATAGDVVVGTTEAEGLLCAFGKENRDSQFEWDEWYGKGFDVLHISGESGMEGEQHEKGMTVLFHS